MGYNTVASHQHVDHSPWAWKNNAEARIVKEKKDIMTCVEIRWWRHLEIGSSGVDEYQRVGLQPSWMFVVWSLGWPYIQVATPALSQQSCEYWDKHKRNAILSQTRIYFFNLPCVIIPHDTQIFRYLFMSLCRCFLIRIHFRIGLGDQNSHIANDSIL